MTLTLIIGLILIAAALIAFATPTPRTPDSPTEAVAPGPPTRAALQPARHADPEPDDGTLHGPCWITGSDGTRIFAVLGKATVQLGTRGHIPAPGSDFGDFQRGPTGWRFRSSEHARGHASELHYRWIEHGRGVLARLDVWSHPEPSIILEPGLRLRFGLGTGALLAVDVIKIGEEASLILRVEHSAQPELPSGSLIALAPDALVLGPAWHTADVPGAEAILVLRCNGLGQFEARARGSVSLRINGRAATPGEPLSPESTIDWPGISRPLAIKAWQGVSNE